MNENRGSDREFLYDIESSVEQGANHLVMIFINKSCSDVERNRFALFANIIVSVLFHRDGYDYYWNVYVHGYPFWTTDLYKAILDQQSLASRDVLPLDFRILD